MKRTSLFILSIAVAMTATAQPLDRSKRPKAGPPPAIKLGASESFTLANGMRVFVVENHKLPTIAVSIQLDVKPALEGDMAGYQDMVGELLTSGTKTKSKDALNAAVDNIGANVNANPRGIFGSSLKRFQNTLLDLIGDMVMNSDFKQTELDKLKKQTLSSLEAAKNNPDAMLANVSAAVNFGANHPYGEVNTDETVQRISLERCNKYYSTYWRPNVAYMAIVGDVTMAEMKPLIEKYFGGWKKADVPVTNYVTPAGIQKTHVALASRDAAVQSVFNVTYPINLHPGEPDVIKAKVANAVLGAGSQGRLFLNLREAHGWTYGAYSSIREDEEVGSFTGNAKCRNAVTDSSITEMLKEMKRMQNETITEEELQSRITYMTGSFAIGLESPQTVAQYAINIERYHMPKDYYTNYLKNLSAVSISDVQAMSRKYITPENANIIVVGNGEQVAKKLEQFGTVEMYDNYGRPATKKTTALPAGVTADDVVKRYIATIGGEKAISGLKDIKIVRTFEPQPGVTITMTEMKKNTGMYMRKVEGMGQTFSKTVYANGKGTSEARGQSKPLEGAELASATEEADLQANLHPTKYGITRKLKSMESDGGNNVYVVEKTDKSGKTSTEYYDAATGLLVKKTSTIETPQGEVVQVSEFSDYKEVPGANGYKIPYSIKQMVGQQELNAKVQTVEVNKGIADSEFK